MSGIWILSFSWKWHESSETEKMTRMCIRSRQENGDDRCNSTHKAQGRWNEREIPILAH